MQHVSASTYFHVIPITAAGFAEEVPDIHGFVLRLRQQSIRVEWLALTRRQVHPQGFTSRSSPLRLGPCSPHRSWPVAPE